MNLRPLPIIFKLARERNPLKPIQHLANTLCRVRQHGLYGHAGRQRAVLLKAFDAVAKQNGHKYVIGGDFAVGLLDFGDGVFEARGKLGVIVNIDRLIRLV